MGILRVNGIKDMKSINKVIQKLKYAYWKWCKHRYIKKRDHASYFKMVKKIAAYEVDIEIKRKMNR